MCYILWNPIGNLGDITYRAIDILKLVDVVFAEDTRITKRLLFHYGIAKKLISCNAVIEHRRISLLLEYLSNGKSVAFVSDAGTPCISDPVVCLLMQHSKMGIKFVLSQELVLLVQLLVLILLKIRL